MNFKNLSKKIIFLLLISSSIGMTIKSSSANETDDKKSTQIEEKSKENKEDTSKKEENKNKEEKIYTFNINILDKNKNKIKENLNFKLSNKVDSKIINLNSKDGILTLEFEKEGTYYLDLVSDNFEMQRTKILVKQKSKDDTSLIILDAGNNVLTKLQVLKKEVSQNPKNGWKYDNKTNSWYYLNTKGNKIVDWMYDDYYKAWFFFDSSGRMKTGWMYDSNYKAWFFFDSAGKMKTGWLYDNNYNAWFYFNSSGKMQTGWFYDSYYKAWFYSNSSGEMQTGWFYDYSDNSWYYFNSSGKMQTGWLYDDDWYYFNSDGKWNRSGISYSNWYVLNGVFQKNNGTRRSNVGSSYFVVNLSDQKLWLVRSNKVIVETGIVSGKPSTPTVLGAYKVQNMSRNTTLRGDDYAVWVGYWIDFYYGYGIHDANWQPAYAFNNKNTYRYSGSHGCVNINPSVMPTIYSNSYIGLPVIVID